MENREDLKGSVKRVNPETRERIQKAADIAGITFEEAYVSLASRFNCDFQNAFFGKPAELNKIGTFRLKIYDRTV